RGPVGGGVEAGLARPRQRLPHLDGDRVPVLVGHVGRLSAIVDARLARLVPGVAPDPVLAALARGTSLAHDLLLRHLAATPCDDAPILPRQSGGTPSSCKPRISPCRRGASARGPGPWCGTPAVRRSPRRGAASRAARPSP